MFAQPLDPASAPARPRPLRILRVDSSARHEGSFSRRLTDRLVEGLTSEHPDAEAHVRDLARMPVPAVDEAWIEATNTPEADRDDRHRAALALSDALVAEVRAADVLVIGAPVYNFSVPASLKAWIDQICRARVTFAYTEAGPKGLLEGKKAYVVVTSGGTPAGGPIDFATGYLRHVLGFIGIGDVEVVAADRLMFEGETKVAAANAAIDRLVEVAAADAATAATTAAAASGIEARANAA